VGPSPPAQLRARPCRDPGSPPSPGLQRNNAARPIRREREHGRSRTRLPRSEMPLPAEVGLWVYLAAIAGAARSLGHLRKRRKRRALETMTRNGADHAGALPGACRERGRIPVEQGPRRARRPARRPGRGSLSRLPS